MNNKTKELIKDFEEVEREFIEDIIKEMLSEGELEVIETGEGTIITTLRELDKEILKYLKSNVEYIIIGVAHIIKDLGEMIKDLEDVLEEKSLEYMIEYFKRLMNLKVLTLSKIGYEYESVLQRIKVKEELDNKYAIKIDISIEERVLDLLNINISKIIK
ncbi:hypothetical protein A500_14788 [Clostridium sartagoforme AAU1]|uniref:Uncharacterized protein n=1 Tax=Clostridium sartagoforme AAU1 TaxID=1202534 RepID=R9BVD8_9CLOT|nr:hypothetical protein [Clostridium sartagoforme]EOR20992.1 hypothetical protein A500_14788 [Clostridium sartagoforme AAU1]